MRSLNIDLINKILIIKYSIDVRRIFKASIESCFVEFKSELIKFNVFLYKFNCKHQFLSSFELILRCDPVAKFM